MKPEEAIEDIRKCIQPSAGGKSLQMAIQALEKQIPKKPDNLCGYSCRACSGRLARQTDLVNQKYCHHCGQKIDWEVTP